MKILNTSIIVNQFTANLAEQLNQGISENDSQLTRLSTEIEKYFNPSETSNLS